MPGRYPTGDIFTSQGWADGRLMASMLSYSNAESRSNEQSNYPVRLAPLTIIALPAAELGCQLRGAVELLRNCYGGIAPDPEIHVQVQVVGGCSVIAAELSPSQPLGQTHRFTDRAARFGALDLRHPIWGCFLRTTRPSGFLVVRSTTVGFSGLARGVSFLASENSLIVRKSGRPGETMYRAGSCRQANSFSPDSGIRSY
ncbi:hypothetical protein BJ170DRAFT_590708 [Xylariales sp. AK1849]|nr:hypothetical protein BJ170DRAFT_590708 [Xylariales sp. AK1849]